MMCTDIIINLSNNFDILPFADAFVPAKKIKRVQKQAFLSIANLYNVHQNGL